jgi:hypothetical protein
MPVTPVMSLSTLWELHIHDLERLLHPKHLLRAAFHERLSMPVVGLERLDLDRASEHPRQQTPYV